MFLIDGVKCKPLNRRNVFAPKKRESKQHQKWQQVEEVAEVAVRRQKDRQQ